jgi:hypothetical protein
VVIDSRTVLHLFQQDDVLFLLRESSLLGLLELEFPIVHDANDGRASHRGHFDEIQSLFLSSGERDIHVENAELRAIWSDHAYGTDPDLPVDADSLGTVLNGW